MQTRRRGQTRRVPDSLLPMFIGSSFPEPLKAEVTATVRELNALWAADPEGCIPPSMLLQINGLLRCTTAQSIDLLRILSGRPPHDRAHSRQNLSALLRGKAVQWGRAPESADFSVGHPMHVFAPAYWGGIERWGQERASRKQLPKAHWTDPANQSAAVQDTANRFQGEPITHALLHRAGYHALASRLSAAELARLVRSCGLRRQLRKGSAADWTSDRVVDDYVALCRTHGVTLSSDALRQIGGAASSLRSRAVRCFGSHAALVRAATAADPSIRPLSRPTAQDGQLLGSWQEVAVYEALRRGLPAAVEFRCHVPLLPGLPRHSCDLVISLGGRSVWVEVLMLGHADLERPDANATARRYAARWRVKTAWYANKGITLIAVEPATIFAPVLMAAKVAQIRRLLDPSTEGGAAEPVTPTPSPGGGTARPRQFWTIQALCEAVRSVAGSSPDWPTDAAMIGAGHGGALAAIKKRKLRAKVAAACGLNLVHVRGAWTENRVVEELVAWVGQHGAYPTGAALTRTGHGPLQSARSRLFAGKPAALRATVEARCGFALGGRAATGSYDTPEGLAELLRPVCDRLGHFPTQAEMAEAGLPTTVYSRISRGYGVAAMATLMGVPYVGPEHLTREQAMALLLTAAEPALLPGEPVRITTPMIAARLGSRGIGILRRHIGSIAVLRHALADQARAAQAGQAGPTDLEGGQQD